ncbi:hypothetical protein, partial [Salinigranum sp. GCM10025319]|uniref:hypothetical protein n=1 Tax=Salinigranum sp. GCM10025319 TaxID=3252687 RepID=UPI00360E4751
MSDDLRTHIEQVAGAGEDDPLDDLDDRLTAAYRALRRHASPETHRVDVETGKSAVAEATRLNKGAVREAVLKPLEQKGYISPQWGTLVVYRPRRLGSALLLSISASVASSANVIHDPSSFSLDSNEPPN